MFAKQTSATTQASELLASPAPMPETFPLRPANADEVTLPQSRVLWSLAIDGPQTVSSLADVLGMQDATIGPLCSMLVTRGFVVRIPTASDTEGLVVALSTGGRRRIEDAVRHQALVAQRRPATRERVPPRFRHRVRVHPTMSD